MEAHRDAERRPPARACARSRQPSTTAPTRGAAPTSPRAAPRCPSHATGSSPIRIRDLGRSRGGGDARRRTAGHGRVPGACHPRRRRSATSQKQIQRPSESGRSEDDGDVAREDVWQRLIVMEARGTESQVRVPPVEGEMPSRIRSAAHPTIDQWIDASFRNQTARTRQPASPSRKQQRRPRGREADGEPGPDAHRFQSVGPVSAGDPFSRTPVGGIDPHARAHRR